MSIENVENPLFKKQEEGDLKRLLNQNIKILFENRPIFKFDSYSVVSKGMNKGSFYFINLISSCSEIFSLSSLKINNIHDLIKEETPSIYYIVSWAENHLENRNNFYSLDNTITFKIKLHFHEEIPEEKYQFGPDGIVAFNFEFENLEGDEDILTKIKTCIYEELENSSDITVPTNLVKIVIIYKIKHTNEKEN